MFEYLRNVRIKSISYGLIVFMIIAGGVIGAASLSTLREVNNTKSAWDAFDTGAARKTRIMSDIRDAIGYGGLIHDFKNTVIRRDASYLQRAKEKAKVAQQSIAEYRRQDLSPEEVTALGTIEEAVNAYASQLPELEQLVQSGATVAEIDKAVAVNDTSAVAAFDAIDALLRNARDTAAERVHTSVQTSQRLIYITLGMVGVMILALIMVFMWFARSRLITPIYTLIEFVSRIGRGDLTQQMSNLARDEVGGLGAQLNQMVANLKEITVQTREAVANLNSAASETLASTKQQAASVEEQFAAIQETTATLDEISQSGQQMSSRARDIAGQAEKASERSKDGLRSMDDLAQVMDAIEEQTESVASHIVALSEKTQAIGDIISTVNDIAERSQLLALNAAIEAAAAGEEGRSFSVVAEEIRTLADQAKEATTQVSSILGDIQKGINASVMSTEESVKRVANGREQAENTLKSITELSETIEASVQAFEQIVASTNQQRIGLEQVSQALQQIRSGSEQTAAGTKQIEQAVTNINSLGSQLDHTMERYAV
jgi:methyl-accepting chemotaxis protein